MTLMSKVTEALTTVIGWVGTVVEALVGTAGAEGAGAAAGALSELLPLFAIGISISALMLGIKAIKSFVWGS